MKKKRIGLWLNIVTICLSLCAIAIGVYSVKNSKLTISGTIGFVAYADAFVECKVENARLTTSAVDTSPATYYLTKDGGVSTTSQTIGVVKDNPTLDFSKLTFAKNSTTKQIMPLTFTFTITSDSADVIVADLNIDNLVYKNVTPTWGTDGALQIIRPASYTGTISDNSKKGTAVISVSLNVIDNVSTTDAVTGSMTLNINKAEDASYFEGYELCEDEKSELVAVPAYTSGEKTITLPAYHFDGTDYHKVTCAGCSTNDGYVRNLQNYTTVNVGNGINELYYAFSGYSYIT